MQVRGGSAQQFTITNYACLVEFCVIRLRLQQDGDVRVRVSPQREEILIGSLGIGGVTPHGIGSADLEMRECSDGSVGHNSAMVEDFLGCCEWLAELSMGDCRASALEFSSRDAKVNLNFHIRMCIDSSRQGDSVLMVLILSSTPFVL